MATTAGGLTAEPPRLVVASDIPVERTAGGMLLLYRLLNTYPADRLLVVTTPELSSGRPTDQLPDVSNELFEYQIPRVIRIRRNPVWAALAAGYVARRYARKLADRVQSFRPEAMLTISHGYLWFAAAAAARLLGVPLHLILHDDWPAWQSSYHSPALRPIALRACRRAMGPVYRAAKNRLCVSPGMEEHYRRWFGVTGQVLYPSRGEDSPVCQVRVRPNVEGRPVMAYCGWVHLNKGPGSRSEVLRMMAEVMGELNGHLDLYTSTPREQLEAHGLRSPVVRFPGFLPPAVLADQIGETAHALLLNASFNPAERDAIATLFPSKLADYTAIGLPVVVWGPAYSSAARWAMENPDAAVLVTGEDPGPIRSAIYRLTAEPGYAARLAAAAIEAGNRYFDPVAARASLLSVLSQVAE